MKAFLASLVAIACIAIVAAVGLEQLPIASDEMRAGENVRLD